MAKARGFTPPFGKIVCMHRLLALLILLSFFTACGTPTPAPAVFPTYDPFLPLDGNATGNIVPGSDVSIQPAALPTHGPTPALAPLSITLVPTPLAGQPLVTPTPDKPRDLPTPRLEAEQYVVQSGDTLGSIAARFSVSVEALMAANGLTDADMLYVGSTLNIPAPEPGAMGPSFKLIPDSELVYGPASVGFDIGGFIQSHNGYLASYVEAVNEEILPASEIIRLVSQNYSVNPRLLLALLEYQSGWVTDPSPVNINYPMGLADAYHQDLYLQLTWTADTLNRGYYLWRVNAISAWVLTDGSVVPVDPTINAGTAAIQHFFSKLDDRAAWESDVSPEGFFLTYFVQFGNPFHFAVEPLVPPALAQPRMELPFKIGETWSFTGGPHGGWDNGSAWAALDFAPPREEPGCYPNASWVTAVADGRILRARNGAVIQDLDNDGYEQTGWVVFYMHIETSERVQPDTYLFTGEPVGHPSCEGGISTGTHLHLARKYNGEWISADGSIPFNLGGWISSGNGIQYDGFLTRGNQVIEAWEGIQDVNQITR